MPTFLERFLDSGGDGRGEGPPTRYCSACGVALTAADLYCGRCGTPAAYRPSLDTRALVAVLADLDDLRRDGVIGPECHAALRRTYEARLAATRPPQRAPVPGAMPVTATVPAGARMAPAAPPPLPPPPPARPLGAVLAEWTAARQADILLYLGAFLLSIAALIFVGYQGTALSGPGRFAILVVYTISFLALGVALPRWERVREAGAVFLALGALLVPVNFIALRTQVLDDGAVPDDVVLLLGASVTALLYFTLTWRGFGRLYALPGALAALAGWGALGSVAGLPVEWFGAWFVAAAGAVANVNARTRLPAGRVIDAGAAAVGACGLLFAVGASGAGDTAQVPAAFGLAAAAVAGRLAVRRTAPMMAMLPALAAITTEAAWWSAFDLAPEWYGVFAVAAGAGYLAVAWMDDPARTRRWGAIAAGAGVLALLLVHPAVLERDADRIALPVTYTLLLAATGAAYLRWRWREALAAVPALAAGSGAGLLWAGWSMRPEWIGAWIAAAALGYLAMAEFDGARRIWWRTAAGGAGLLALLWAHVAATFADVQAVELPAVYGLLVAGAVWDAVRHRDAGVLALPALAAAGASSTLWAAGLGPEWWIYPGLAAAALIAATEPWWRGRPVLREAGRPYALLPALLLPIAWLSMDARHPAHGLAANAVAAAVFLVAALRSGGALTRLLAPNAEARPGPERFALLFVSDAFVFASAGFGNAWAGLGGSDRAWVYLGLGAAAWLGLALLGRTARSLFEALVAPAIAAIAIAAVTAAGDNAVVMLVLTAGAAGPLLAFPATRRWLLFAVGAVSATAAVAFLWAWRDFDPAYLPLAYVLAAGILWGALTPLRTYEPDERGTVAAFLSWAPWLAALTAAYVVVVRHNDELPAGHDIVRTREWATMTVTVALSASALVAEGLRLTRRWLWVAGTAGLLLAALFAIGIARPANVQAYTLPIGLYLLALAFTFRRSPALLGPQMSAHEAVLVLGLLFLVLPPAAQSFAPGGDRYGLELIAFGLLFLAAGVILSARWLVAGGVLTLSGVAVRWLTIFGAKVPYWLTLGLVGTALLAIGLVLLLQRERWERLRSEIAHWWAAAPAHAQQR